MSDLAPPPPRDGARRPASAERRLAGDRAREVEDGTAAGPVGAASSGEVLVERLSRSLQLSAAAGALGMVGVILVYLFLHPLTPLLVVVAAGVAHQAVHVALRRSCRRGEVTRTALWFCLTDWAIVLIALVVVPAAAAALVPIVLARVVSTLPYLDRPALRRLLAAALVLGVVVGVLSRVDLLGTTDRVHPWVVSAFVSVFVAVGIAIVVLDLWQHSATLRETADRALTANAALRASESALAAQAEELRRSRARLLVAADSERRRVERDLHDGAQQTLTGLALGLSVLAQRQPEGTGLRSDLQRLEDAAQDAVRELRELAHGVYPPVLVTQGLGPALAAVARRSRVPVRVDLGPVDRRPPEQEAAVYFCVREALQNADKHAGPDAVADLVLREEADGSLRFSVSDSGCGFEARTEPGAGLVNMHDRLAAVGGDVVVHSHPGAGVRVTGTVPAPDHPVEHDPGPGPSGACAPPRPPAPRGAGSPVPSARPA